jgi:LCP family protein required for cell wall assembly
MLISIDPEEKRASLISIPRDLQVTYEENGYKQYIRINAVHVYGYDDENKGSGAAAAKKAVSDLLGVPVHYFLRVDFMGFESLIDELGGVTVDVPHRLYDYQYPDENYGYEVVKIEPGVQVMDGKVALQYARSRHAIDAGQASDLSRAERQQAVMMAVKEKAIASKWNLVSNPTRLAGLLDTLKDNVLTDIQLEEMVELAKLAKQIDTSNPRKVASMVLGPPLIYHEDRPGNGWRYYLADTSGEELRQAVADFLVDPFLKEDIVLEEATVRLENGTTQTGIASEIGLSLRQNYGITTESPVNADRKDYDQTVIRDLSNGQASRTVEFLERYFGVESYVPSEIFPGETADVVVVLGQDQTEGQKNAGTP